MMTDRQELASWLRLTLIPGVGGEARRALLKAFGNPKASMADFVNFIPCSPFSAGSNATDEQYTSMRSHGKRSSPRRAALRPRVPLASGNTECYADAAEVLKTLRHIGGA